MLIQKIRIKNFRSIVDETIELGEYNCFVGRNDCGKSNVLKALNLFFNNQTDAYTDFDFSRDFSKFAKVGKNQAEQISISLYVNVPSSFTDSGIKIWTKVWRRNGLHDNNINTLFTKRTKAITFLSRIIYHYIPAVKSDEYFRELLVELYDVMLSMDDAELSIANIEYSNTLQILSSGLSDRIKKLLDIKSYLRLPDNLNEMFRNLSFETSDKYVNGIDLNLRGDGIKARHIPSIVKYIQDSKDRARVKNAVYYSHIWGYEEPENGVELASCFEMAEELYSYRKDSQMLITSHSPAFYSLGKNIDSKIFYVYKSEQGNSNYNNSINEEHINRQIGLLDLITPFVETERSKYVDTYQKLEKAEREIQRIKGKVVIITEGKTDTKHIMTAFSKLGGLNKDFIANIQYYDFEDNATLGDDLPQLLDKLSRMNNESKIIGLFDRDKKSSNNQKGDVIFLKNNVYKAFIPPVGYRKDNGEEKICIEHYYTDEEIKTLTQDGRLYMGNDFNEIGVSLDKMFYFEGWKKNNAKTNYMIIDSDNKHLNILSDGAKCISKSQFADFVVKNTHLFDFENFRQIYDLILSISQRED